MTLQVIPFSAAVLQFPDNFPKYRRRPTGSNRNYNGGPSGVILVLFLVLLHQVSSSRSPDACNHYSRSQEDSELLVSFTRLMNKLEPLEDLFDIVCAGGNEAWQNIHKEMLAVRHLAKSIQERMPRDGHKVNGTAIPSGRQVLVPGGLSPFGAAISIGSNKQPTAAECKNLTPKIKIKYIHLVRSNGLLLDMEASIDSCKETVQHKINTGLICQCSTPPPSSTTTHVTVSTTYVPTITSTTTNITGTGTTSTLTVGSTISSTTSNVTETTAVSTETPVSTQSTATSTTTNITGTTTTKGTTISGPTTTSTKGTTINATSSIGGTTISGYTQTTINGTTTTTTEGTTVSGPTTTSTKGTTINGTTTTTTEGTTVSGPTTTSTKGTTINGTTTTTTEGTTVSGPTTTSTKGTTINGTTTTTEGTTVSGTTTTSTEGTTISGITTTSTQGTTINATCVTASANISAEINALTDNMNRIQNQIKGVTQALIDCAMNKNALEKAKVLTETLRKLLQSLEGVLERIQVLQGQPQARLIPSFIKNFNVPNLRSVYVDQEEVHCPEGRSSFPDSLTAIDVALGYLAEDPTNSSTADRLYCSASRMVDTASQAMKGPQVRQGNLFGEADLANKTKSKIDEVLRIVSKEEEENENLRKSLKKELSELNVQSKDIEHKLIEAKSELEQEEN